MFKKEPIHCIEKDKANTLMNKNVLFADHKEGLGYYGVLSGFSEKTGKFLVEADFNNKKYIAEWIVEV